MAFHAVMTSVCRCTFGAAPCPLPITSQFTVFGVNQLSGTVMDNKLLFFGPCSSLAFPATASATAAAQGALTPMPCVSMFPAPWVPGAITVMIENKIMLNNTSKLFCAYGGVVSIESTPALSIETP